MLNVHLGRWAGETQDGRRDAGWRHLNARDACLPWSHEQQALQQAVNAVWISTCAKVCGISVRTQAFLKGHAEAAYVGIRDT